MDTKLSEILDSLPPKTPRSRLEPYREFIREMRRRGWTYRDIAQVLGERCQVQIASSTVHEFVIRRSRAKPSTPKEPVEPAAAELPAKALPKPTPSEVQARIRALKQKDAPANKASKPMFAYDESEPLRVRLSQPEKANL